MKKCEKISNKLSIISCMIYEAFCNREPEFFRGSQKFRQFGQFGQFGSRIPASELAYLGHDARLARVLQYSTQIRMTSSMDLKKMAQKRYSHNIIHRILSHCKTLREGRLRYRPHEFNYYCGL